MAAQGPAHLGIAKPMGGFAVDRKEGLCTLTPNMIGRLVGGKYSLEREIGRGGMGSIWVALDTKLHRRVALKLMRPDMTSPSSRGRFEREAMAVARIQHPNVIQIHEYGIDEEAPTS